MPAATKRKATGTTAVASKKAKLESAAIELVNSILEDPKDFELPATDKAVREVLVQLAGYARGLEEENVSLRPREKSDEELQEAANKLAAAAVSGITKQCTWKPSCKDGGSKWAYDGVCSDPAVFAKMLKLDGPPTFKAKKIPADEFQDKIGRIKISARYNTLYLLGNVNVQWKPDEGTFKFSGTYGVYSLKSGTRS